MKNTNSTPLPTSPAENLLAHFECVKVRMRPPTAKQLVDLLKKVGNTYRQNIRAKIRSLDQSDVLRAKMCEYGEKLAKENGTTYDHYGQNFRKFYRPEDQPIVVHLQKMEDESLVNEQKFEYAIQMGCMDDDTHRVISEYVKSLSADNIDKTVASLAAPVAAKKTKKKA